jgi:hypothetical protein
MQLHSLWLTGRWDVETSEGRDEDGRRAEADCCATETDRKVLNDSEDDDDDDNDNDSNFAYCIKWVCTFGLSP